MAFQSSVAVGLEALGLVGRSPATLALDSQGNWRGAGSLPSCK